MKFQERRRTIVNGKTTYLNDYNKPTGIHKSIPNSSNLKYEEFIPNRRPVVPIDQESFNPLRHTIPFDLMIVPNEITRGDPHKKFGKTVLPEDERTAEVMKTRPRVFLTPQVSLDDAEPQEVRNLILNHMYTSDNKKAGLEVLSMIGMEQREVPDTVIEHTNFLGKSAKHYFSVQYKPEESIATPLTSKQIEKGKEWSDQQLIAVATPDEYFWEHKEVKCGACQNPLLNIVDEGTKRKIYELVEKDQLRMPHDIVTPGYDGYKPDVALGIGIEKNHLPCAHPLLSTMQVVSRRQQNDC